MAASFSARGRGSTCPPPAHVVQVTHTWRRRPLARPGVDVAARRGRRRRRRAGPGLRLRAGPQRPAATAGGLRRSSPAPLRSLSAPRRRPDPAGLRIPPLHRDGATPERRGGSARSCRDMPQRVALPCAGKLRPLDRKAGATAAPPVPAPRVPRFWSEWCQGALWRRADRLPPGAAPAEGDQGER